MPETEKVTRNPYRQRSRKEQLKRNEDAFTKFKICPVCGESIRTNVAWNRPAWYDKKNNLHTFPCLKDPPPVKKAKKKQTVLDLELPFDD